MSTNPPPQAKASRVEALQKEQEKLAQLRETLRDLKEKLHDSIGLLEDAKPHSAILGFVLFGRLGTIWDNAGPSHRLLGGVIVDLDMRIETINIELRRVDDVEDRASASEIA